MKGSSANNSQRDKEPQTQQIGQYVLSKTLIPFLT
jgi:hypothetical protein